MPKHSLLDELAGDDLPNVEGVGKVIPNVFPTITNIPYRIAIVGEAPGKDEEAQGIPFVGWSGSELNRHLSRFGIVRDACFIGNVCRIRPPSNKLANFDWNGPEIQSGITQLEHDLSIFNPNIVLCLGGTALHVFMSPYVVPKKRKTKDGLIFVYPNSIGDWRGSFFISPSGAPKEFVKCIATYHPAACMRNFEWTPYMLLDIQRCRSEAESKELALPQRDLLVKLPFHQLVMELEYILVKKCTVGTDIEGHWNNWRCISFAPRPDYAFIVPWTDMQGHSVWTVDEEVILQDLVARILAHPRITKVWQNGLYDRFVLQYGYNVCTCGPSHDIMLRHWELYCELEKALAVQASLYTKEPYYKGEIDSDSAEVFWRYCCKDSAVTIEVDQALDKYLNKESQRHYQFNLALLNSLLYMELRGLKYDKQKAKERHKGVQAQIYELQFDIDKATGRGLKTNDKTLLRAMLREVMCYKRDSSRVKVEYSESFDVNLRTLLGDGPLTKAELGRLSIDMGVNLNVKGQQLKDFIYGDLSLPKQYDPVTGAITADYEALLTLSKKSDNPVIPLIITMTELRTRMQMLEINTDLDGRVRTSYILVGSETGRIVSRTSPTGSGYNLQTIPDENELKPEGHPLQKGMRDLIIADEGCYLAKCDLRGADGWTVGANLAALGDSTMLDDLTFGLKPASVLCYGSRHGVGSIAGKSRGELVEMCREVKKTDWDYYSYKQCIWGFCYLMGVRKAAQHVFNTSEGTVSVSEQDMQLAKDMLIRRYNLPLWWKAMERRLFNQPYPPRLTSPSGHTRIFFGRKTDVLGQALAHEPQSVTTYATNTAIYRMWTDPDNRIRESGRIRLRIEPLHQVHDEAVFQFKIEDTTWALGRIKQWFNNEIVIAGIPVTIPYEGSYGLNWAMDLSSKKGSF